MRTEDAELDVAGEGIIIMGEVQSSLISGVLLVLATSSRGRESSKVTD